MSHGGRKYQYIWMKVTSDEYELPIAVADSAQELADMLGINKSNIMSCISHSKSNGYRSCYMRLKLPYVKGEE